MLVRFEVGKRAPEPFSRMVEGSSLTQDKNGALFLVLGFSDATEEEIMAVRKNKIQSYVLTDSSESYWMGLFKIADSDIDFDCTFNMLDFSPLEWDTRVKALEETNLLRILLIDPRNGILKAQRMVTMPKALIASLRRTALAAVNAKEDYSEPYAAWINKQYALTSAELIKRATRMGILGEYK